MPRTRKPVFTWDQVSQADQLELLNALGDDGHSVYNADGLKSDGLNAAAIDAFTRVEKSDGSYKGTIFTDSGPVKELRGVYGLSLLRSLAGYYGIESHKFGRGSEARELTQGVREKLDEIMREGRG